MDPYSPIANKNDEDESFINQPSFAIASGSAYDEDHEANKPMKAEPSAAFAYSSAPDPTILSSAAGGDLPEFEKIGAGNNNNNIMDADKDFDSEDEGFGHSTYGQRMDYTNAEYQDKFYVFMGFTFYHNVYCINLSMVDHKTYIKGSQCRILNCICLCCNWCNFRCNMDQNTRKYSGKIIKIMLYGNLLFLFVTAFIHFVTFQMFSAIIYLVFAVLFGLYIWSVSKRILFTAMLIDIACLIINQFPSVVVVSLGILIMQIIWILWWSAIAVAYISQNQWNDIIVVLLLISFY